MRELPFKERCKLDNSNFEVKALQQGPHKYQLRQGPMSVSIMRGIQERQDTSWHFLQQFLRQLGPSRVAKTK